MIAIDPYFYNTRPREARGDAYGTRVKGTAGVADVYLTRSEAKSCRRDVGGIKQAHSRRAALSRILPVPLRAGGTERAGGAAWHRAAHRLAGTFYSAARQGVTPDFRDPGRPHSFTIGSRGATAWAVRARLDLRTVKEGAPLKDHLTTGFAYSDCRVDDARLVVLNAVDARERGACIRTRTRCVSAKREQGMWRATLLDMRAAATMIVIARALVDAAGPWAAEVFNGVSGLDAGKQNSVWSRVATSSCPAFTRESIAMSCKTRIAASSS